MFGHSGFAKVLSLILYSPSPEYDQMREIQERYMTAKGIEHYFYWYDPELVEDFVVKGNEIRIRGTESLVPGILLKTIRALELTQDREYDFVVRSNVSTVINFDEQQWHLHPGHVDYGGCVPLPMVESFDLGMTGEKFQKYAKYPYMAGFHLVLSRRAVDYVIRHQAEIIQSIVDDMVFGIFFHPRNKMITGVISSCQLGLAENKTTFLPNRIAYRHKFKESFTHQEHANPGSRSKFFDRSIDLQCIEMVTNKLLAAKPGMISRVIHQIQSPPANPGGVGIEDLWMDSWRKDYLAKYPNYTYKFWSVGEVDHLLAVNPGLATTNIKYYILFLFGGIYIDASCVWLSNKPFDEIINRAGDLLLCFEPTTQRIGSHLVASTQYNPKLLRLLRGSDTSLEILNPYKFSDSGFVENTTVLPSYYIHPVPTSGIRDPVFHMKAALDPRSYAICYDAPQ